MWRFSGRFVRLHVIAWTQRFSRHLFFIGRAKSDKRCFLLDVLEQSGKQQHWNILQQHTLFNVLPPQPKFLFSWSIIMHKSHWWEIKPSGTNHATWSCAYKLQRAKKRKMTDATDHDSRVKDKKRVWQCQSFHKSSCTFCKRNDGRLHEFRTLDASENARRMAVDYKTQQF